MADEFKLIQLIREVVDEINRLIETARPRLYDADQLQSSAESIGRNTREAFGRRVGPERNQYFRVARGSAEEADEPLRENFAARRLGRTQYYRLHNRLILIRKMLTSLMK